MEEGGYGHVHKSVDADKTDRSWGWPNCIPLARCHNYDFLSPDGILTIQVRVDLLAENFSRGGFMKQLSTLKKTQEELSAVKEEMSGLKRKLAAQDTELTDLKSKVRKVEEREENTEVKTEIKTEIKTEFDC